MVVRPKDIIDWSNEGVKLEALIDLKLKEKWNGENFVHVSLPQHLPDRIVKRLISLYETAGWTVTHNKGDCQKDGEWNYLEFRAVA